MDGYGVLIGRKQLDEAVANSQTATKLMRNLLSVFFKPDVLAASSALGSRKKPALDRDILDACFRKCLQYNIYIIHNWCFILINCDWCRIYPAKVCCRTHNTGGYSERQVCSVPAKTEVTCMSHMNPGQNMQLAWSSLSYHMHSALLQQQPFLEFSIDATYIQSNYNYNLGLLQPIAASMQQPVHKVATTLDLHAIYYFSWPCNKHLARLLQGCCKVVTR